ncbi:MAG: hypothetical protein ACREPA_06480 [Candidatus Dormibacteraceae bacterium]
MRLFTAAYLVLLALVTVPTTVHFSTSATMRAIIEKTPQARGLRPADLQQAADADAAVAVGVALFLGIVYLIVAGGALRGWRWAFWLSVILLALESLSALTGLNSIAHPGASPLPRASLVGNWILSLVGVALFVWLLVGLSRFGPWAVRWPKRR